MQRKDIERFPDIIAGSMEVMPPRAAGGGAPRRFGFHAGPSSLEWHPTVGGEAAGQERGRGPGRLPEQRARCRTSSAAAATRSIAGG
eukprot:4807787-Pyramimonas_sp.AAC.1